MPMVKSANQNRLPPYVSHAAWSRFINKITVFLPDIIDNSFFEKELKLAPSTIKKMRTALVFLNLINDDDNKPTEDLQRLHKALQGYGKETQSSVLRDILYSGYSFIFDNTEFNIARATQAQLTKLFENIGARNRQLNDCKSFFLQLAIEADVAISPLLTTRSRVGTGRKSNALKSREQSRIRIKGNSKVTKNELLTNDVAIMQLHPAMLALLKDLAEYGEGWNEDEKAKFKTAFEAVFDIAYPSE